MRNEMFQPREIVYGYVIGLGFAKPKYKYLIILYRDADLEIFACFTTSQHYYGVQEEEVKHGAIKRDGEYYSFVFEKDVVIGIDPRTGNSFSFPCRTTITFNYGIRQGEFEDFESGITNKEVVCVLNKDIFADLLYAMYKSPEMNDRFKPYLEKSLEQLFSI